MGFPISPLMLLILLVLPQFSPSGRILSPKEWLEYWEHIGRVPICEKGDRFQNRIDRLNRQRERIHVHGDSEDVSVETYHWNLNVPKVGFRCPIISVLWLIFCFLPVGLVLSWFSEDWAMKRFNLYIRSQHQSVI